MATPMLSNPALASSDPSEVVMYTWSGYEVEGMYQPYLKKHGVMPSFNFFSGQEEAMHKVRTGYAAGTMHPCTTKTKTYRDAGILKAIDPSRIEEWGNIWPRLQTMAGVTLEDVGLTHLMPFDWGNTSICYRTDVIDRDPSEESWNWLFDPQYAGRISMQDGIGSISAGALALGIKDPYQMTEAELDKSVKYLQDQRPMVRFYWESPTEFINAMANGEIDMAMCWNDAAVSLKRDGYPVRMAAPKEGMITRVCGLVMTNVGEADEGLVYDALNSLLAPETGFFLIDEYGYGHANQKAFDLVSAERLQDLGISNPSALIKDSIFASPSPIRDMWDKAWEDVKLGL
jgi:spermidine/putrescine transport system substrate-binding protein